MSRLLRDDWVDYRVDYSVLWALPQGTFSFASLPIVLIRYFFDRPPHRVIHGAIASCVVLLTRVRVSRGFKPLYFVHLEDSESMHYSQQGSSLRKFALVSFIENTFVGRFLSMNGKLGFLAIPYPELTLNKLVERVGATRPPFQHTA
ncbi:MAG: hypothetical protein WBA57_13735 [Elainellaceae cyanobacterium]